MTPACQTVLAATGYLEDGAPSAGLKLGDSAIGDRRNAFFMDSRIGLAADAAFTAQGATISVFKDCGLLPPSEAQLRSWHEIAWNIGVAPLLWVITPTKVLLYDCYSAPSRTVGKTRVHPDADYDIQSESQLRQLDAVCGRLATETGAFWASELGRKIDRRHRVDRQLLGEIAALEKELAALPPANKRALLDRRNEERASLGFAQRLIGRTIFTWYLIDRGIAQKFFPPDLPRALDQIFAEPAGAFALFTWLKDTFNGDLFPMDDAHAERMRLGSKHLELLRDFVRCRSLMAETRGQGRLFRFRFDAIPVDLISSIYQQFARSSASGSADEHGLHYTPFELVHMTLDPVFEGLPAEARVIDPTCGSGAFLVEAFRRLVWKRSQGGVPSRKIIRDVLSRQLYGIDINRSALGIAAFSLYLAAIELDQQPISDVRDLKFDRLIDNTLFEADATGDALPDQIRKTDFDAVVGNPPWTFSRSARPLARREGTPQSARPRRSPDQVFLRVAAKLAGDAGRIGMIMKASPFFSRDQHAISAREQWLTALRPTAIVNLSALRKEGLFPDARGPALLLFARCTLMPREDSILVGSVPWTQDFRRNGIFHIGPGELKPVPLRRVLQIPSLFKAAAFGTLRDAWLVEKLEREFHPLGIELDRLGLHSRGQGYQVGGGDINIPPEWFYKTPRLTPEDYQPLLQRSGHLGLFDEPILHRVRQPEIYRGPVLICPKGCLTRAIELGRYSAAVHEGDVIFNESFYGISFAGHDKRIALVLSAILNSSTAAFQLALGGGPWGLERPTVEPEDVRTIRVPDLSGLSENLIRRMIEAQRNAVRRTPRALLELDRAVAAAYQLDDDELLLTRDSIFRARMMIFESHSQRKALAAPPSRDALTSYLEVVARTVNRVLMARGARHVEPIMYSRPLLRPNWVDCSGGLTAVKFVMAKGGPRPEVVIRQGSSDDLVTLEGQLRGQLGSDLPPYLNERRQLRIYRSADLIILKPSEAHCWSVSAALSDADHILADHWLAESGHAPYS